MNNIIDFPKPIIKQRIAKQDIQNHCLDKGLHPLLARIIASREIPNGLEAHEVILPKLASLGSPYTMADIKKAAVRLAKAIVNKEYIGIETDHDCDGQTSHAVIFYNLNEHFKHPSNKIYSYIGHRLKDGYGLSVPVVEKILQETPRASLIVTADNGSSDEARIKRLKEQNIDVIVTDHHEIPKQGIPASAYACLNPTRSDCAYQDSSIAGCMVAWLLMVATREELIACNYLPKNAPKLIDSLDFVAVGTVADCVSMAKSRNNRAVVCYGLKHIQAGTRPCWRAINTVQKGLITAEDIAFKIAPILNSDGRLSSAFGSVSFLLAENDIVAKEWIIQLKELNKQRKSIQKDLTLQGLQQAAEQVKANNLTISIFLEESHTGVHGVSASNIKEYFGRPTAFFAPKINELDILTGSIRGIDDFHVMHALQYAADQDSELFIAFGGHQGAGGVSLKRDKFPIFVKLFEQAAKIQLGVHVPVPTIFTDGEIPVEWINLDILQELNKLEPYGREFETPVFQANAKLINLRIIGDGTHARVTLDISGKIHQGVWFSMRQSNTEPIKFKIGEQVTVVYSLKENNFNDTRKCELQVVCMQHP